MLTMKARAKKARRDAYLTAKERRKNDPRTAELRAKVKAMRHEASAQAKARRKTDPKQLALKEKRKRDRRAANAFTKQQRKTLAAPANTTVRADEGERPGLRVVAANTGTPEVRIRSLGVARVALTVIEGGKSPKAEKSSG